MRPLDALSRRFADLQAHLAESQEAARAANFIARSIMPVWWAAWQQAFESCPAESGAALTLLRAEFRCMKAIENALRQMAEGKEEIETALAEVAEETREAMMTADESE